jgi:hypothetical protein
MSHEESPSTAPASPRISPRLVALNVALLAILVVVTVTGSRPATAQPPAPGSPPGSQPTRGRGEYTMVCGKYAGATSSAVYIVDAANQEIVVLGWDRASNRLTPIGFRSLTDDAHYLTKPR